MGYHLNRHDEPIFMAVSKPLLTESGIHHRLESCGLGLSVALIQADSQSEVSLTPKKHFKNAKCDVCFEKEPNRRKSYSTVCKKDF